jgi:hypothetical protein
MRQSLKSHMNRPPWLCMMSNTAVILSVRYTQFRLFEVSMDNFVTQTKLYLTKRLQDYFDLRIFYLLFAINMLRSQLHMVLAWSAEHGIQIRPRGRAFHPRRMCGIKNQCQNWNSVAQPI